MFCSSRYVSCHNTRAACFCSSWSADLSKATREGPALPSGPLSPGTVSLVQAHGARVADAIQTSSVKQTVLGWASGVKKAVSDQASMKKAVPGQATASGNFQPVAVSVWATENPDDKESTRMVDSYTKSSLFSSPWDAAAAAAQPDASECDEVDYELLWAKGPEYWSDHGDDWGTDE